MLAPFIKHNNLLLTVRE